MDRFTTAYIECALWSSTDNSTESGGYPLDDNYDISDIAPETLEQMKKDCADFQSQFADLLTDYPDENAGHDFWLTRNRHGAGFWENDFGTRENCKKLTEMAHAYGSFDLYVGDDGKIHGS